MNLCGSSRLNTIILEREMAIPKADASLPYAFDCCSNVSRQYEIFITAQLQIPIILLANVDQRAKNAAPLIDTEQGQQLAKLLGNDCVFVETSIPTMQHGRDIIDQLIKAINEKNPKKVKAAARPGSAKSATKKPVLSTVCSIL